MLALRPLRVISRHWKLAAIAVFSLSIAMSLAVVGLSVSNTFLFLQPAAPHPEQLVTIHTRADEGTVDQVSYPDFLYYREHNHVFTDLAATPNALSLLAEKNARKEEVRVFSRPVSDNYFAVLGIHPFLGRFFAPGDDDSKTAFVVMTYACWQRLGADRQIVGKTVAGQTVIGVTPPDFTGAFYGFNGDLFNSIGRLDNTNAWRTQRDARRLFLTGRLKPGVSLGQAQTEMKALSQQLASAYPRENLHRTAVVAKATLLSPDTVETRNVMIGILMAAILLVILIACANVANLLLAIAVGRRQETSVKLALGASRRRLIREFLVESALLCIVSGALGYAIAAGIIARYSKFSIAFPIYGSFSFDLSLRLDFTVAAFTGLLVLLAILITGLPPAFYASSPAVSQALSGEVVVGGTGKNLRRNLLVVVQVAICTLVWLGMGLCQRSLYNLRHVDTGFSARNLVAMQVTTNGTGYSEARGKQVQETIRLKAAAVPGVESVTMSSDLPLNGFSSEPVQFPDGKKSEVNLAVVDNNYFRTFGIRLREGREFNAFDQQGHPDAVIVNRRLATMLWPKSDPIGKQLLLGEPLRHAAVVGLVGDGKYEELSETPKPYLFLALNQHYRELVFVVARTKADPRLSIAPLARIQRELGLETPLMPFTLDSWMNLSLLVERLTAMGVSALSGLGLLLAAVGLFGSVSWSVSERKKELGIRVALGATPPQLLSMILRQTLLVTGSGTLLGLCLGVGGTLLVRSLLYQIAAVEWIVFTAVGAAMLLVSATIAYLSARPWVRVSPMEAVRHA